MKRLETAVKDGQEMQTAAEPSERPQSGGGKIVDFRKLGAVAKRYSGLAAALVCVIGLAAVAGVVNPEAFVIGGGVSKAGEVLLSYIEKNYKPLVFHGSRDVKFTLATLGNDAGIYGAAKLVLG